MHNETGAKHKKSRFQIEDFFCRANEANVKIREAGWEVVGAQDGEEGKEEDDDWVLIK